MRPSGWTEFCSRCYKYQAAEKDWADAEQSHKRTWVGGCMQQENLHFPFGGNLPIPKCMFLRELVFEAANSHKRTWVGGYDAVKEGVWLWSDGNIFDFNLWHQGEPNNLGGEHCMEINLGGNDFINDRSCQQQKTFVCVKDP
ncbi:galactose-specific lectin nattectin-like protein [Lates japonicus]|uniref:Galactose-specific lectin nattectin-like protein n=1 Tax=Lates japonicus TaxID=270547 RepID=A0AAD3QZN2_LATJO|nr:galactose-specific lectin nattectin-like protein [Lates japonicus]